MVKRIVCSPKCRFCEINNGIYEMGNIDKPFLENDKYFAVVSAGSIVEGWFLIVPKKHVYSMQESYKDQDFFGFADELIRKVSSIYHKKCIVFEHGANHEGSVTACGTNHAHLHIIPYEKSLLKEMRRDKKEWFSCMIADIPEIVQGKEYWFYSENITSTREAIGYVHIIKESESQYFRKLIAEKENRAEQYDYKKYLFEDISEKTYQAVKE